MATTRRDVPQGHKKAVKRPVAAKKAPASAPVKSASAPSDKAKKPNPNPKLTISAARRLALSAGVTRASSDVYQEITRSVQRTIETVIKSAALLADHGKRKRINSEDIVQAVKTVHSVSHAVPFLKKILATGKEGDLPRCSLYKKSAAGPSGGARKVVFYQKTHGACVNFSKTAFKNLAKKVLADDKGEQGGIKAESLTSEASGLLQVVAETTVVRLLTHARSVTKAARRTLVTVQDMEAARKIASDIVQ
jgi:histone H3/H4